ncbi:MAG: nucleoside-diphosphate sugar epimerase/dehydratase [Bacilli bacterium]|nr:nucleoside-diphosphate sugar epimerase/dehydratase [Bacilli bacterium]
MKNKLPLVKVLFLSIADFLIIGTMCLFSALICSFSLAISFIYISIAIIILKIASFWLFGIYKIILSYFGMPDMFRVLSVSLATSAIVWITLEILTRSGVLNFINIYILQAFLVAISEAFLLIAARFVKRIFLLLTHYSSQGKATLVVGAGAGARLVYDEINNNPLLKNKIVAFIDDDQQKIGRKFMGKKVYGPISSAHEVIESNNIEEVIIAIGAISQERLHGMIKIFGKEKVRLKKLPSIAGTRANEKLGIIDFSLEELLNREPVNFDVGEITNLLKDKVILITGAGGSIGSELSYQILTHKPKHIVLLDIYENGVYDVEQTIKRRIASNDEYKDIILTTIIASTYNKERMEQVFSTYRPQIIYHAAAYKHVPLMENNPQEAIRTNIIGTFNVAEMANKYEAQKMILVSTDKAVRPTNVMGATKRFAEMIMGYFKSISTKTAYSSVRFGNVLGSNGSAIPLFEKQIQEGGPITITDPNIIRYFMTIPEAVSLILQCSVYASSGEIFILDMGVPIKIVTIAENLIKQSGLIPYEDIKIEYIGLRPGEKLYEELLVDKTKSLKTPNKKIFIEKIDNTKIMDEDMKFFVSAMSLQNNDEIKTAIKKIVKDYICG